MSYIPDSIAGLDDAPRRGPVTVDGELPKPFGWALELDLGGCDDDLLNDRAVVEGWGRLLCKTIGMTPYGKELVEWFGEGDLEGFTGVYDLTVVPGLRGVQRLTTSAAVVHCNPPQHGVHIDVFSCREFDPGVATRFNIDYFAARTGTGTYRVRRVPSLVGGFQFDFPMPA